MVKRFFWALFSFMLFVLSVPCSTWAEMIIHSQVASDIEILAYNSLTETSLFKGKLLAGSKQEVETSYHGLALLVFAQGQNYPLIIGEETLTMYICSPAKPPSFPDSAENDILYRALSAKTPVPSQYPFAARMIQAKNLLDSSYCITTIEGLRAKKKEFLQFITENHQSLKHSDMIIRLIAQYFMMHEYVDYHIVGTPTTEIKTRYQQEVLAGVANLLKTLSHFIPEHEILNYCVSLYYKRSMVTLAALIMQHFRDKAYCPGEDARFTLPADLSLIESNGAAKGKFADLKGTKVIAVVSARCPVSMVAAVSKARQLAQEPGEVPLIIVPQEKLSPDHLAMGRMVSKQNVFFIDDEKWRQENHTEKLKLPLFIYVEGGVRPDN